MILSSKHIALAARVFVILFVAANSGFTAVIQQCTMQPVHTMDCCAAPGGHNSSSQNGSPFQGETTVVGVSSECHSSTVVGGLVNLSALVEKENTIHPRVIVSSTPLFWEPTLFDSHSTQSVQFSTPALAFSPWSVEKCVLNSTFLI
jgi:hypothetical protein